MWRAFHPESRWYLCGSPKLVAWRCPMPIAVHHAESRLSTLSNRNRTRYWSNRREWHELTDSDREHDRASSHWSLLKRAIITLKLISLDWRDFSSLKKKKEFHRIFSRKLRGNLRAMIKTRSICSFKTRQNEITSNYSFLQCELIIYIK